MSTRTEAPGRHRPARRVRNRRGEGGRLRDDILEAATRLLAERGSIDRVSLRAVARKVGIATTSIYLHFGDIEELAAAVVARAFAELDAARDKASEDISDPGEALLARSQAYCRFALDRPGLYQVMFGAALPDAQTLPSPQAPGRRSFEGLVQSVERCQRSPGIDEPVQLATLLWATLHGLVSLRINRPRFPWPPLEDQVADAVRLIVGVDRRSTKN
jgi:AcrR family transcriptional regulator